MIVFMVDSAMFFKENPFLLRITAFLTDIHILLSTPFLIRTRFLACAHFFTHGFFLLPILFLLSCHLPVGEKPPLPSTPHAKLDFEPKCLADVLPIMARFMSGEASPQEINSSWDCFASGLDLFHRKVKGLNSSEYSAQELARFFEDFFLENLVLSDRLILEMMRLKQIFVGGGETTLTRQELLGLIQFSHVIRDASLEVLPYMKILSMNGENPSLKEFEQAQKAFEKFIAVLGTQIQKNNTPYKLSSLVSLLEEVSFLYQKDWVFVHEVKRLLPLIESLKNSLIGGDKATIYGDEWTNFSKLVSQGHLQYLRYFYFIEKQKLPLTTENFIFFTQALSDLFSYLEEMISSKPDKALTKFHIESIVQSLNDFFPSLNFSKTLIEQIFLIKTVFLGGSPQFIFAKEFTTAQKKLVLIQEILQKTSAIQDLYFLRWQPQNPMTSEDRKTLKTAVGILDDLWKDLTPLFESSYDLVHFSSLIRELLKLPVWNQNQKDRMNQVLTVMPLVVASKKIIVGSGGSVISQKGWGELLSFVLSLNGDFLQYFYTKQFSPSWRESLLDWDILLHRILTRVEFLIQKHKGNLRLYYFDEFFYELNLLKVFSEKFPVTTVKRVMYFSAKKLLWPSHLSSPEMSPLYTRKDQSKTKNDLVSFQRYHIETAKAIWLNFKTLHDWSLHHLPVTDFVAKNDLNKIFSETLPQAWKARAYTVWIKPSFSLISTSDFLLSFSYLNHNQIDRTSFQNQNIFRVLTELISSIYSEESSRFHLTWEQYTHLFVDIKPILTDLGIIHNKNQDFPESRFLEANLFTPSANGNQSLEYTEAIELFQFLFSGEIRHSLVLKAMEKDCSPIPPQNENTGPLPQEVSQKSFQELSQESGQNPTPTISQVSTQYPLSCWFKSNQTSLHEVYNLLPQALTHYAQLNPHEFNKIWNNLLLSTGYRENADKHIAVNEFSLVPHAVQYSEAIIHRFDLDQNEYLNRREAMKAFPVFKEMLQSASKTRTERLLKGGYSYILVNKRLPQTLKEKFFFMTSWVYQEIIWPIQVDRSQLSEVLKIIAELLRKSKNQEEESFLDPYLQKEDRTNPNW
jgi:hypothetical protein